jgi:hypothetical protein
MMAFEWNKGGDFMGRPWSNELPTDSALVLYLFAAYVTAPRWEWPTTSTSGKGSRCVTLPIFIGMFIFFSRIFFTQVWVFAELFFIPLW